MLEHRCFDEEVRTRLRADSIIRQFIVQEKATPFQIDAEQKIVCRM